MGPLSCDLWQKGPCRQALQGTPISRKTSASLHWSSHVVLTLAGLAEGSLGLLFPFFPSPALSLGSFEELAIEEDVVQVGRGDHRQEPPSSSMLRPPTGGPPPGGGQRSGSGETKARNGPLKPVAAETRRPPCLLARLTHEWTPYPCAPALRWCLWSELV